MSTARAVVGTLAVLALVGCAMDSSESVGTDQAGLRCVDCGGGGGDPPPPKKPPPPPPPKKPPPAPVPLSFTITPDALQFDLGVALGGTVIQLSQDGETPASIQEGQVQCHIDLTAEKKCQQACEDGAAGDGPGDLANCLKACQGAQTTVCTPAPVCGTYQESSFIEFPSSLTALAGQKACDASDCQACTSDGKEPALFDRGLTGIPYPMVTHTAGLITYHCAVTKLRFDVQSTLPVAVDLGGIHLTLAGTANKPSISCDNGAPDLDVDNPTVIVDLMPTVTNGAITVTTLARFTGNVSAHDPLGNIIDWIDDAQDLVTTHATTAINNQVSKIAGPLGAGLDSLVRKTAPSKIGTIDHIAYGSPGLTVYYFPG